ncbi:MAG TPA: hypothetical protein VM074_08560 [Solimonas sp.]|nr:hypothetical protein [Solimonas sp.]
MNTSKLFWAALVAAAVTLGNVGCRADYDDQVDGGGTGGSTAGGSTTGATTGTPTGGATTGGATTGGTTGGGPIGNYRCITGAPAGSTSTATEAGLLCQLTDPLSGIVDTCNVSDVANASDGDLASFATMQYALGLLDPDLGGSETVTVDLPGTVPAGQPAAFLIDFPGGEIANASVLRSLTLTTLLNGTVQDTFALDNTLELDILGLMGPTDPALVGGFATQPYNQISLTVDAALLTADLFDAVRVYDACLAVTPNP